jgi:hypothetical protein
MSFKSVFDPMDLEIIDLVYEVAWAHAQAREPSRNAASDCGRQEALRRKIFGIARIQGPGPTSTRSLRRCLRQHLNSPSLSPSARRFS